MSKDLNQGRWFELSLMEQLGNIGSEVHRSIQAHQQKNLERRDYAIDRALELFDLTLADPRWRVQKREVARAREVFCDALLGDQEYGGTLESLDRYFFAFGFAARLAK